MTHPKIKPPGYVSDEHADIDWTGASVTFPSTAPRVELSEDGTSIRSTLRVKVTGTPAAKAALLEDFQKQQDRMHSLSVMFLGVGRRDR